MMHDENCLKVEKGHCNCNATHFPTQHCRKSYVPTMHLGQEKHNFPPLKHLRRGKIPESWGGGREGVSHAEEGILDCDTVKK